MVALKFFQFLFHNDHQLLSLADFLIELLLRDKMIFVVCYLFLEMDAFLSDLLNYSLCALLDFHYFVLEHFFKVILSLFQLILVFPFKLGLSKTKYTFSLSE